MPLNWDVCQEDDFKGREGHSKIQFDAEGPTAECTRIREVINREMRYINHPGNKWSPGALEKELRERIANMDKFLEDLDADMTNPKKDEFVEAIKRFSSKMNDFACFLERLTDEEYEMAKLICDEAGVI